MGDAHTATLRSLAAWVLLAAAFVGLTPARAAAAGPYAAVTWGSNTYGQLGDGTDGTKGGQRERAAPVFVRELGEVKAVAAGDEHSLALLANGTVAAWGNNSQGQLGNGKFGEYDVDLPVAVSGLSKVTQIAAGGETSMALLSNGAVEAWGQNYCGQLGDAGKASSNVPVTVSGLTGVVAIAFDMALRNDGTVWTWGCNREGQLGNGTTTESDVPVRVSGLTGVSAIATGGIHDLAVLGGGTVSAWGGGTHGELGNGAATSSDVPVAVTGLTGVSAIGAGEGTSYAVMGDGTVRAWGDNYYGQLANGTTTGPEKCGFDACSTTPLAIESLSGVTGVTGGGGFAFARLAGGALEAWGRNTSGELGDNTNVASDVPTAVASCGLSEVVGVAAGFDHSVAFGVAGARCPQLPVVRAVKPESGPEGGGTPVTIEGEELTDATSVTFGANAASSIKVNSPTSMTAVAPAGSGTVDVTVTTPEGTSVATSSDRFTYAATPDVTRLEPAQGPRAGGTSVAITGTDLSGATQVTFGTTPAQSFTVNSATSITAFSPPGSGTVDVVVTTPAETSPAYAGDRFTYESGGTPEGKPPEFGQCVAVGSGAGAYANATCTKAGGTKGYEWLTPGPKRHFTTQVKRLTSVKVERVDGLEMHCTGETGTGEITGPKTVGSVFITLTGCELGGAGCNSEGARAGEVVSSSLTGELGVIKKSGEGPLKNLVGLDLKAQEPGPVLACDWGPGTAAVAGSMIVPLKGDAMVLKQTLTYAQSKGLQQPSSFEGMPQDVLEFSLNGDAYKQAALALTTVATFEEKLEVNQVV